MGYEQTIPPIPDRKEELEAMHRLEQSWLNQPYYKYYMNESLREPKMAYAKMINKAYAEFFAKVALSTIALIPIALISRRFFVKRGTFPVTYTPTYFEKFRTDNEVRRWAFIKWVLPIHFAGATFLAYYTTDFENMVDPNYQWVHKAKKLM